MYGPFLINYNSSATIDDGSCLYSGCTEVSAINYDSTATVDDGNCLYQEALLRDISFFGTMSLIWTVLI